MTTLSHQEEDLEAKNIKRVKNVYFQSIYAVLNHLKKLEKINLKINQFHRFLEISQMSF